MSHYTPPFPTHTHPLSCLPRTPTVCQDGAQEGERGDGATVLQGESGDMACMAATPMLPCTTPLSSLEIAHTRVQTQRNIDWNRANQALVPTIATKIIYSYGCSSCSTGAGASSYSDGSSLRWHIHTDHMPTHIHAQSFTQLTKKDAENLPATYEYQ
jgi:hypothetical protein